MFTSIFKQQTNKQTNTQSHKFSTTPKSIMSFSLPIALICLHQNINKQTKCKSIFLLCSLFVQGIVLGLSGVVTSPIHGGIEKGVKGFFQGIGKGLLGLITKPLGGTVDAITLVLEGIERASEAGEQIIGRLRIPRFVDPKKVRLFAGDKMSLDSPGSRVLHKHLPNCPGQVKVRFRHQAF